MTDLRHTEYRLRWWRSGWDAPRERVFDDRAALVRCLRAVLFSCPDDPCILFTIGQRDVGEWGPGPLWEISQEVA